MNALTTPAYFRATLKEAILNEYPGSLSAREIVQSGKIAECLLVLLDRLEKAEARIAALEADRG